MVSAKQFLCALFLLTFISTAGCSAVSPTTAPIRPSPTAFQAQPVTATPVIVEEMILDAGEGVPQDWINKIAEIPNLEMTDNRDLANLYFVPYSGRIDEESVYNATRIFVAAVPFFTITDEISTEGIRTLWNGNAGNGQFQSLLVSEATKQLFTELWEKPGDSVLVYDPEEMLDYCEQHPEALTILPFEQLSPRWKVLKIDGLSPLDKPLVEDQYALTVRFGLFSQLADDKMTSTLAENLSGLLPETNRDESKMTVLIMTGTTAITRVLAYKISIKGMSYPIEAVSEWFEGADLKHVSNESPLVEGCPVPDEFSSSLVFCTPPEMIEVLDLIGINVVELTGNHVNDYGPENLEYTMEIYKKRGWNVYAAGINTDEARSPVLVESNGNKLAFIGCNAVGPATVFARDGRAGAAECEFEYLDQEIRELKEKGYVVVTTFQHEEEDNLMYFEKISRDFQKIAAAGADIVQGSQAHSPMGFEFVGENFIHYGLGNFLFDQMVEWNRREFIDRHIIYDGEYVNTELKTALLVDWSRPTPMTEEERKLLLEETFKASLKRKNENK